MSQFQCSAPVFPEAVHPLLGNHSSVVPPLAGLCSYAEAAKPGYTVEENVLRLKRFNWVEQCLCDLVLTKINFTPEWEVKGGLGLHIHLDCEHARALQSRVAELRHPPHNFNVPPSAELDAFC